LRCPCQLVLLPSRGITSHSRGLGRGAGVGRCLGVGIGLGVLLGVGVGVVMGLTVGVGVSEGVAVGVGVGVPHGSLPAPVKGLCFFNFLVQEHELMFAATFYRSRLVPGIGHVVFERR